MSREAERVRGLAGTARHVPSDSRVMNVGAPLSYTMQGTDSGARKVARGELVRMVSLHACSDVWTFPMAQVLK